MRSGKLVVVLAFLVGLGGLLPTVSAAQAITTDDLNVKDYGAMGDGMTDDTLAIQQAIDDAVAASTAVYFPMGEYLVSNTLVASIGSFSHLKALRISGEDSILKAIGNIHAVLSIDVIAHFTMEGLVLDGNHRAQYGLKINRVVSALSKLKDITVKNAVSHGLFMNEAQLLLLDNVVSTNNGGAGFYALDSNGAWFDKTTALNNDDSGYIFLSDCCSSFTFLRSAIAEGNLGHGIHYTTFGQGGGIVNNSWIENNHRDGIRIDSFNVVVFGTRIQGTGALDNRAVRINKPTDFSGGSRILSNYIFGSGDPAYETVADETGVMSPDNGNVILNNTFGSLNGARPVPIPQPAESPFRPLINVKNFGAVGDGVTDDTAALQNALDLGMLSKQEVYLPRAEYAISAPLEISRGVKVTGEWALIKATEPMSEMLLINGARYLEMKRIVFLGNDLATSGIHVVKVKGKEGATPGLTSSGLPFLDAACWSETPVAPSQCPVLISQVEVKNTTGDGFVIENSAKIALKNLVSSFNDGSGLVCRSCKRMTLEEISSILNGQDGIHVMGSYKIRFDGIDAEINKGNGVVLQSDRVEIRHSWVEGNNLDAMVIDGKNNTLLNSRIINGGPEVRAVRITAGGKNTVFGNHFAGGGVDTRTIRDESGQSNDLQLNAYAFALSMRNLYLTSDAANPCPVNTVCIEK